jgi:hypothetical protein
MKYRIEKLNISNYTDSHVQHMGKTIKGFRAAVFLAVAHGRKTNRSGVMEYLEEHGQGMVTKIRISTAIGWLRREGHITNEGYSNYEPTGRDTNHAVGVGGFLQCRCGCYPIKNNNGLTVCQCGEVVLDDWNKKRLSEKTTWSCYDTSIPVEIKHERTSNRRTRRN